MFLIRSSKFRERIDAAVNSAQRASKYALQKADIAISRTATSRGKAEQADSSGDHARVDSEIAISTAREFAVDFKPALLERFERIRIRDRFRTTGTGDMDMSKSNLAQLKPLPFENVPLADKNQREALNQTTVQSEVYQQPNVQTQTQYMQSSTPRRPSLQKQPNLLSPPNIPYAQQNYINSPVDYNQPSGQFAQSQPPGPIYTTPQKQQQSPSSSLQSPNNSLIDQHQQSQYSHNPNPALMGHQHQNLQDYGHYGNGFQHPTQQPQHQFQEGPGSASVRRNSRMVSDSGRPLLGAISQSSIDYFDHYKRPPSRDSSIDRYTRAASRLGGGSRQASVDRTMQTTATMHTTREPSVGLETPDRGVRGSSQLRGTTPVPSNINGSVPSGFGSRAGTPSFGQSQVTSPPSQQPFEDVILRQRTLGQDIVPSLNAPKRTESLYLGSIKSPPPVVSSGGGSKMGVGRATAVSGGSRGAGIKVC